jgi:hypothetical protein
MATAPQPIRVVAAMDAALAAERATEEAVREAQQAGTYAVRAATERAALIARRCDERVRGVHDSCASALARRVSELLEAPDPVPGHTALSQEATLDAVLNRVAAWLTTSK